MLANALGISLTTLGTSSSGQKRKRQDDWIPPGRTKRSKSDSRRRSVTASRTSVQIHGTGEDRRHGAEGVSANSLTAPEGREHGAFKNRIFSCLVIFPPGRAIHEFNSVAEFLEACRDFLQAHRSLHFDGKILHRDISDNNLIITDPDHEGDPKGVLIDLDLAKELDGGPSGARHRTGTMEFMAIEVLEGRPHTYRHDLEAFFYVFLWVVIGHQEGTSHSLLKESQLRRWYVGSYQDIADTKRSHMDKKRLKGILAEFPPTFDALRGLAEKIRDILFPIREESLFTGTYNDPDKLYQPMIEVFEREIAKSAKVDLEEPHNK